MDELSASDRTVVKRARRLLRFLTQPFLVTEAFTGLPGSTVPLAATLAGCRAIIDGEADDWAESSLYMVGDLDDARRKEAHNACSSRLPPRWRWWSKPTRRQEERRVGKECGSTCRFGWCPGH